MRAAHVVSRAHAQYAFDPAIPPVLTVEAGDTVTFETDDGAYERLWRGLDPPEVKEGATNPVTGPVFVRGAHPGDALRVEILDVAIERCWAVWFPGYGSFKTDRLQVRPLDVEGGRIRIGADLTVALEPMIGCIGTAPSSGRGSTYEPAYPFGGNLDLRELSAGATLYLPVFAEGALLSVGDLHAAMGAGEPASVGFEARGSATVLLDVETGRTITHPRLRVGSDTLLVGIGDTLDAARTNATAQAWRLLTEEWGLAPFDAFAYASARVSLRFGGPAVDMVLAVVPDRD